MKATRLIGALLFGATSALPAWAQTFYLHSNTNGVEWTVIPQDEVPTPQSLFQAGYTHSKAVKAVVPGTVFNSYVTAGIEKDPNFGDNIHQVDRNKYDRSFWYRTEFTMPENFDKELVWLNFNGINRKGEIYLNGTHLGTLDGFMHRGHYNITKLLKRNGANILAVLVDIPKKPLANEGSPHYLSSGGWDWMPYVPGLNSGLTDKVWLENTGTSTLQDPWVRSALPSLVKAELSVSTEVSNHGTEKARFTVKGTVTPGDIAFTQDVELEAGQTKTITFDKRYFPQLVVSNPRLWWPNGMGEPNLYSCRLEVGRDGQVSETKDVRFGIRKYSYDKEGNVFHIHINGVPVFIKGGNWGMSEYMLRCREEDYKTRIALHKEMNFNMIRNWLGSVTDDEFYQYCDEYGIMVWDDFWLNSNPTLPYDIYAFNFNAVEKIKRLRNHACIAVWCGNNEGSPEPPLEGWLTEDIRTFDGGDRYFQARSNHFGLSGSGPWGANDQRWYFTEYPDCKSGSGFDRGWGFRTEIGTAVVPEFESFKKFMPEENWWPIDEMWNKHYFGPSAFNATPERYTKTIEESYGGAKNAKEFCRKGQLINLESNKALYEGWLDRIWDDASGIMTWMSQSAYPSMVWQTYDYYYDLTGAYWGCKQACEPVHIYWNPVTEEIKVVNTTADDYEGLTAEATVYNMDGRAVARYSKKAVINSLSNTAAQCFVMDFNKERDNLSLGCPATASSTVQGEPGYVTDGKDDTRWASFRADNEWIYVDLGSVKPVGGVRINFEAAFGKAYKIQTSLDGKFWNEIYSTEDGKEGINECFFPEVEARYVRMLGIQLGWWYGYSIWSMDVLGGTKPSEGLSDVHFLRLTLKDKDGRLISENNYWRGNNRTDFRALNDMPEVKLGVSSKLVKKDGKAVIQAQISLPKNAKTVAFATHVQAVRTSDGERILPAFMNDNYFTLVPGETKRIDISFDEALLQGGSYKLIVEPYNNTK